MSTLKSQLLEAWEANETALGKLLDLLNEETLAARYAPRVRNVGMSLIHMHNVRRAWLGAGGQMPESVGKIERKSATNTVLLSQSLQESGNAIRELLGKVAESGKVPGFKKSPVTFLGYLLAHEAHHRGQIMATLRINGVKVPPADIHSLWEWDE